MLEIYRSGKPDGVLGHMYYIYSEKLFRANVERLCRRFAAELGYLTKPEEFVAAVTAEASRWRETDVRGFHLVTSLGKAWRGGGVVNDANRWLLDYMRLLFAAALGSLPSGRLSDWSPSTGSVARSKLFDYMTNHNAEGIDANARRVARKPPARSECNDCASFWRVAEVHCTHNGRVFTLCPTCLAHMLQHGYQLTRVDNSVTLTVYVTPTQGT